MFINYHEVSTQDDYINLGFYSYEGSFFQIGRQFLGKQALLVEPGLYFKSSIWMECLNFSHFRHSFDLIDVFSDIGGILEMFVLIFGFLVYPISKYSFYIESIQKSFLVECNDKSIFKKKILKKNEKSYISDNI